MYLKKKYRTPAENPMKFCERAVRGPAGPHRLRRKHRPCERCGDARPCAWESGPCSLRAAPVVPAAALSGGAGSLTRRRGPCRLRALSGHRRAFPLPSTAETRHDPGRCPWPVAASLGPGRRCPTDRSQTSAASRHLRVPAHSRPALKQPEDHAVLKRQTRRLWREGTRQNR